jgi:hypothetical protein
MKRTILAGATLLLVAACGASGGGSTPGGAGPAGKPAKAPAAVPAEPISVPAQGKPLAPSQAPAPVQRATPQPPAQPAPSAQPGAVIDAGTSPAERGGTAPHCPMGTPPIHRLCPV